MSTETFMPTERAEVRQMPGQVNPDSAPGLPDYNELAVIFDRFLPLLAPVADAILDHLPALPAGARVLDVACGTGEPALTLARRPPDVQLLGVDAAGGMIEVARAKAEL
jgi:2-polyprenyl-3-methyl-5-hydroxy-6-metoxy-1,4-benzoquinol methylase